MGRYSTEQREHIVKIYHDAGNSVRECWRALRTIYGPRDVPCENTIQKLVRKFHRTGSVHDIVPNGGRPRSGRSAQNVAAVAESVKQCPEASLRQRADQLGLSRTTTWSILKMDLGLKHMNHGEKMSGPEIPEKRSQGRPKKSDAEKAMSAAAKEPKTLDDTPKRGRGRPKGSLNKKRRQSLAAAASDKKRGRKPNTAKPASEAEAGEGPEDAEAGE